MGRLTATRYIKAAQGSGGILSVIAKRMSVSRQAVHDWLKNNPEFQRIVEQERESTLDLAVTKLINAINNGEPWAIKHYLNTQGKSRNLSEHPIQIIDKQQNNQINVGSIRELLEKSEYVWTTTKQS